MRKEDSLAMQISKYLQIQYPGIIFHLDLGSGGVLSIGMAMRNKRMNPWRGWPDLFIPAKRGDYSGLFIEIKKEGTKIYLKDGRTLVADSHIREQGTMLEELNNQGFACFFGVGFDSCKRIIDNYLKL